MEAQQTSQRQVRQEVARTLEDYMGELLATNDPATMQTLPPPPAWHALNEEVRDELVELLQEAVADIRRQ